MSLYIILIFIRHQWIKGKTCAEEKPQQKNRRRAGLCSRLRQRRRCAGAKEAGGGTDEAGGLHCAGAGTLWRGGAIDQLRRGRLRAGPSFERRGLEELPRRRQAQREAGSGGALRRRGSGEGGVQGKVGFREAASRGGLGKGGGSRRRALGRRATRGRARSRRWAALKPALSRYCREGARMGGAGPKMGCMPLPDPPLPETPPTQLPPARFISCNKSNHPRSIPPTPHLPIRSK